MKLKRLSNLLDQLHIVKAADIQPCDDPWLSRRINCQELFEVFDLLLFEETVTILNERQSDAVGLVRADIDQCARRQTGFGRSPIGFLRRIISRRHGSSLTDSVLKLHAIISAVSESRE